MNNLLATVLMMLVAGSASAGEFLRAQGQKVEGSYIVVFKEGAGAQRLAEDLADSHRAELGDVWRSALNGTVLHGLSEKQARAIAARPDVAWVEEDGIVTVGAVQSNPPWGLDRIDQRDIPLSTSYTYDFDGSGVHAYILDTGIRETHAEFGSRASRDFDVIGDGQNGNDCHGHGTHVAGTLGGSTYGVAKNVRLHAVRVLDCFGNGTWSQVISGVDWVKDNAVSPAVANMSLGGGGNTSADAAVDSAVDAGIFFAVSAGNNAADACNFSPARAAEAYTVGATTSSDTRASFSNWGTCVDTFAPGFAVTSAWRTSDTASNTIDGTSMASPHVAGVAALLLDENPGWSVAQIRAELDARATAGRITDPGSGSPNRLLFATLGSGGGGGAANPPGTPGLGLMPWGCQSLYTVSWSAPAGAVSYELQIGSASSFSTFYSGPDTSRFGNFGAGAYFRVRACNSAGCSGWSNVVGPTQWIYPCF